MPPTISLFCSSVMPLCKGLNPDEFDYFKKNFEEAVPNVVLS